MGVLIYTKEGPIAYEAHEEQARISAKEFGWSLAPITYEVAEMVIRLFNRREADKKFIKNLIDVHHERLHVNGDGSAPWLICEESICKQAQRHLEN